MVSGRLRLTLEGEDGVVRTEELGPGESRHIPVGRTHRYEAIERVELIEVSSPELDDVVRVEDDFGRQGQAPSGPMASRDYGVARDTVERSGWRTVCRDLEARDASWCEALTRGPAGVSDWQATAITGRGA